MMKNQKRAVCLLACLLIAGFTAAQEKKESAQTASGSKEEGNRNVMLNASSANGPREISIGLPGGDVNVLENGLPVVYTSNPHNVNTHWRWRQQSRARRVAQNLRNRHYYRQYRLCCKLFHPVGNRKVSWNRQL